MGSAVSPIVCNLYIEDFERKALDTAENTPHWWKRYVDDTYTVLKKVYAQQFSDHLNTVDDAIKWTTEGEIHTRLVSSETEGVAERVEKSLAFLDTRSVIKDNGSIKTKVFRKDTHTDQYLHFDSNHPQEYKRGVVTTLMHRVDMIVSDAGDKESERTHVKEALARNGYPDQLINSTQPNDTDILDTPILDQTSNDTPDPSVTQTEATVESGENTMDGAVVASLNPPKRKFPIVVPCIRGVAEQLRRVFKHYDVPAYCKHSNTIIQLLVWPKDKILKERVVRPVYHIPCDTVRHLT